MSPWHPLPHQICSLVENKPGPVLLHISRPGESVYSRLFTDPLRSIEVRELGELKALFSTIEEAIARGHFAAGYFTYECAQHSEPAAALRPHHHPDLLAWFGIYDHCNVFDHRLGTFDSNLPLLNLIEPHISGPLPVINFGLNEQQFTGSINQIHDWIRAGDVYQLNFTFSLRAQFAGRPSELYAQLAFVQPVDYGAFLHTRPGHNILSLSPELFFRVDRDRHITTQPMKGTAPRGRTNSEDTAIADWLAQDAKNRAENVMIVDLIRNDLGRICSFGSVRVDELFKVTRYPSLWQMTSGISGDLRPEVRCEDIFRALFPCGSITGAPKVHAMQLLAQIEAEPRGVYTGAIGYFSEEETAFNVAIRTLEVENGTLRGGVGSGIVIDSEPAAEYRECQLKARFLTDPAEPFSLIETMLWKGSFPFLDLHLDRLSDSANYFGFACDRDEVRRALLTEASRMGDEKPCKFRLLLEEDGRIHLEIELLPDSGNNREPLAVCIAAERTNPADRFLFHKTTRRELYNGGYGAARASGFADVLFLNTHEEVTEGAVNNVFIEKDGRWFTPSIDCGVLPGIYRRNLLATRPDIGEKILTLKELKAADGVYICNAVRGLRRVTIDWDASPVLS